MNNIKLKLKLNVVVSINTGWLKVANLYFVFNKQIFCCENGVNQSDNLYYVITKKRWNLIHRLKKYITITRFRQ